MKNRTFPCIIPTLVNDYQEVRQHLYMLFDMLSINKLIFIGPEELRQHVAADAAQRDMKERIFFLNENELLDFDEIKKSYYERLRLIESQSGPHDRISRTGWYYQQFLKMVYSRICDDEYYLSWDADTIPLRPIEMFNSSGIPFLDIKYEYMHSYFDTINNLFGFGKVIKKSFISEHMLFNKQLMTEMIDEILSLPLSGNTFYDKIFSAITHPINGFSEFETYGSWVAQKHPSAYQLRDWKSIRNTNFMISRNELTEDDLKWLATGFDAAGFERYQETEPELKTLFRNPLYREKLPADVFYKELLEMGLFGEYRDGGLIKGDNIFPV